jgi:hypothetical protein
VRFCTESRPKQYLPDFAVSSYIPTVNGLSFSTSARSRGVPLPLGPPRKWIIGNLLQMPKGDFVTQTTKWAKEYGKSNRVKRLWINLTTCKIGPIYYIQLTPNSSFNPARAVFDLVESRSAIYCHRCQKNGVRLPHPLLPSEIQDSEEAAAGRVECEGRENLSPNSGSGRTGCFRVLRRLLQDGLDPRAAKNYHPIQMKEARVLLKALAEHPDDSKVLPYQLLRHGSSDFFGTQECCCDYDHGSLRPPN